MRSNLFLLVRTLLCASGSENILKYEKDQKKRRKIIGGFVGQVILYVFFAALFILLSYGLGTFGRKRRYQRDLHPFFCAADGTAQPGDAAADDQYFFHPSTA